MEVASALARDSRGSRERPQWDRGVSRAACWLLGLLVLGASAPVATGTGTDPTLALSAVVVEVGTTTRAVRLTGEFPADDLVQLAWPLQVLIHEAGGPRYVRYDLSDAAFSGLAPGLADGLDSTEAMVLLVEGAPSPDARVLFLGAGRIELLLPASFPSGGAVVQMFVLDEGEPILSNPLPFDVDASP